MAERGRSQSNDEQPEDEPHYHGHRERLRERLLEAGPAALPGITSCSNSSYSLASRAAIPNRWPRN